MSSYDVVVEEDDSKPSLDLLVKNFRGPVGSEWQRRYIFINCRVC